MSDTFSTHYNWTIPAIGTSAFAPKINADLESIDGDLFTVSEAADAAQADADAAQSTADDAFAGKQGITPTAITLTGGDPYVCSIDLDVGGPVYRITQTNAFTSTNCNITFTNRPATLGKMVYLHFIITQGSGNTFVPVIQSASKQWAIPFNDTVSTSGTQTIDSFTNAQQVVYPIYIVAGV